MKNNFSKDYYYILGIKYPSEQAEIKKAYYAKAKLYHPDTGGTTKQMQAINEAYSILKDEEKKKEYDIWYADKFLKAAPKSHSAGTTAAKSGSNPNIVIRHILIIGESADRAYSVEVEYYDLSNLKNVNFNYKSYFDENRELYFIKDYTNDSVKMRIVSKRAWYEEQERAYEKWYQTSRRNHKEEYILYSIKDYLRSHRPAIIGIACVILLVTGIYFLTNKDSEEAASEYTPNYTNSDTDYTSEYDSYYEDIASSTSAPISMYAEAPMSRYEEETPPEHNTVYAYSGYSPNFEIETTSSESSKYYYLKIVDSSSETIAQAVFIHAGNKAKVYVPNGTYKVRWVCGDKWYGYTHLFDNTTAQEAEKLLTFTDNEGWEITLYPVARGNLSTETIDIEDF